MALGRIHSIESMGLVDGPGIRAVVFLQGCRLRCAYCHNPDMWSQTEPGGLRLTARELAARLARFKPYWGQGGGVTLSGGEPLLQADFLRELLPLCREAGMHVCLDTAGEGLGGYEAILAHTDLILYDVKHYDPDAYLRLTGRPMTETLRFLEAAQAMRVPLWIRHVAVPGLTDGDGHFAGLEAYLQGISGIERVELLPYHTLGVHKYRALGMAYALEGVPPAARAALEPWERRLNQTCRSCAAG